VLIARVTLKHLNIPDMQVP